MPRIIRQLDPRAPRPSSEMGESRSPSLSPSIQEPTQNSGQQRKKRQRDEPVPPKIHTREIPSPSLPQIDPTHPDLRTSSPDPSSTSPRSNSPPSASQSVFDQEVDLVSPLALKRTLLKKGLHIREMAADGNCMFRAIADQIFGDQEMHAEVRRLCMNYMERERDHFSQFVAEDFQEYLARKRKLGTFGNHVELQAMAELFNRPIFIYVTDDKPLNIFQTISPTSDPPIRLSYHAGNHYNSVRDPENPTVGLGLGMPGLDPMSYYHAEQRLVQTAIENSLRADVERDLIGAVMEESEKEAIDQQLAESAIKQSDLDEAELMLEEYVLRESLKELK